jgi:hypothetical protein
MRAPPWAACLERQHRDARRPRHVPRADALGAMTGHGGRGRAPLGEPSPPWGCAQRGRVLLTRPVMEAVSETHMRERFVVDHPDRLAAATQCHSTRGIRREADAGPPDGRPACVTDVCARLRARSWTAPLPYRSQPRPVIGRSRALQPAIAPPLVRGGSPRSARRLPSRGRRDRSRARGSTGPLTGLTSVLAPTSRTERHVECAIGRRAG